MKGNPFAGLNTALEVLDDGIRREAGKCQRCGKDRGGIVPAGHAKGEVAICTCTKESRL